MLMGMAYVSPVVVLRAAPFVVRVQFWAVVIFGMLLASVTLSAVGAVRQESVVDFLGYWPAVTTVLLFTFNVGILWQQLSETKRRIDRLETSVPNRESVADQFAKMTKDLDAFGTRFERYLQTVQGWTSSVEHAVHETQQSIARLEERMKSQEGRKP